MAGPTKSLPPPGTRPISIGDVASDLGLSKATVSRALNNPNALRSATVARVREAIKRLGYRPNIVAQNLKKRTTGIVFVIVPGISSYFLEMFRGTERAAQECGYSVVMGHTDRQPERERRFLDQVSGGLADGALLVPTFDALKIVNDKHQLPHTVLMMGTVQGLALPAVRVDHYKAAMDATNHLIALGHRRIAHITGPVRSQTANNRRAGYLAALLGAGIMRGEECCVPGEFNVASGETAMTSLLCLPQPPTAVFAANDLMAIGAIRVIKAAGLKVPQDISVIGFNDQRIAGIYDPPLTTIHVPVFDIGYNAMVKLRCILAGEDYEQDLILKTTFVQRSTTASPNRKSRDR